MSENHLGDLLQDAVPEPPRAVDAPFLVQLAARRQARRRGGLAAVAVVALVAAAVAWLPRGETTAVPAGAPSTAAAPSKAAADAPCPPLQPDTDDAAADYLDLLVWQQEAYVADREAALDLESGDQVTTVGCSIAELTRRNHNLVGPMPWPDRTATFLPSGSPVYAIKGTPSRCRLLVRVQKTTKAYTAVDLDSSDQAPLCPTTGAR